MNVLLVFEQRAVQRRDELGRVFFLQRFRRNVFVQQQFQPIEQLGGGGLLLQARHIADLIKDVKGFGNELLLDVGIVHVDDFLHRVALGKLDVVEEAAAQEGVRQFLFVVRGDEDDRAHLGLDRLAGLVNEEFHAIEFEQKIVGEFYVRLVDLVDEQNRALAGFECLPELALLDVVLHVLHALVAELAVTQARHRVIFIKALLRLGGGFHMPGDERGFQRVGDLEGQLGLAGARLALDEERPLQRDGGVDRDAQIVGRDIAIRTFKPCVGHGKSLIGIALRAR